MPVPGPEDIIRTELPNGIVLLVRENHSSPSAVVSGYLRVGAYDERSERAGLASFTARALMRGTTRRSFEQIYEELEPIGAGIGFSSGTFTTGFGAKCLAEDLPLIIEILADALRHPTFPQNEVERLRGEILTGLEERAHDTRAMASLTFHELAYPAEHPYHRSLAGYPETVAALKREDLADFYAGGYGPQGMVIVVVGAVKAAEVLARVAENFGDWEGEGYRREPLPPVSRITGVRRRTVAIPGKTQADIVLGYPGPRRTDPHFLEAAVCNSILGVFGLMGRLGEKVRDEQGLAYYSFSRLEGGYDHAPWLVAAGVNPVNIERAIEFIRAEIRRICTEPVEEEELRDNRAFITGSLPLRLETNEGVAGAILDMERFDLGLDYLQRYAEMVNSVTIEQVQAAAQRWLNPDAYALAIAGPSGEQ